MYSIEGSRSKILQKTTNEPETAKLDSVGTYRQRSTRLHFNIMPYTTCVMWGTR